MITFDKSDNIFVLGLGDSDNRFNPESVAAINDALAVVEAAEGPAALVTVASGKIWHNGLDLDWMGENPDNVGPFLQSVERVFARLLTLPVPTVAAVQGHCFAGGAMFGLAHDHRVMREDRGFFCLPEVDLGMSFTEGMAGLIGAKIAQPGLHRLAVLGQRVPAPVALAAGAIDSMVALDDVQSSAQEIAASLAPKAGKALVALRKNFYGQAIESLS